MTTEVQTYIETGLSILDEKEETLKALAEQFQGLTVAGLEDKDGFDKLRKARITLKNERVSIKNAAEELRAPAVKWQKKVIEREKQLVTIIEPVEDELHAEEKRIDVLKEEARKQKEMLEAKILQDRLNALAQYNFAADWVEVKHMTDDQFDEMLAHAKNLHEEELKRQAELKAEEERKRKEEEECLRLEREELTRQRAEQEAREAELQRQEQERIAAERKRQEGIRKEEEERQAAIRVEREKLEAERRAIEEEKRKHEEAIRIEQARKEAAERAKIEEQARIKREAEEKAEAEHREMLKAERQERLKPDKDKLTDYVNRIIELSNDVVGFKEEASQHLYEVISCNLRSVADTAKTKIEQL